MNMDKGLVTGFVFIDLAKAFDTVDYDILIILQGRTVGYYYLGWNQILGKTRFFLVEWTFLMTCPPTWRKPKAESRKPKDIQSSATVQKDFYCRNSS